MNGIKVPVFMKNEELPAGYNEAPNPYVLVPKTRYRLRAMVNYAKKNGEEST